MGTKLFVGSLPFETTDVKLSDLFSKVGKVESANVITDRNTGRSRGFGFVEMSSEEEAKKAIEELNGSELKGRNIVVAEARPRENEGQTQPPQE